MVPSRPTRTMQLPVRNRHSLHELLSTRAHGTKNVLHRDFVVARTQAPDHRVWALVLFILEESAVKPFAGQDALNSKGTGCQ